jgi:hypothetical protein
MAWAVVVVPEVGEWILSLDAAEAARVQAAVDYLADGGPAARRPYVGTITGSRHPNMKELRHGSIRILFAFDPDQQAILLVGADKAREGWGRWYPKAIKEADRRFDRWLARR